MHKNRNKRKTDLLFSQITTYPFFIVLLRYEGNCKATYTNVHSALVERFNQTSQLIQRNSVLLYVRITRASTGMQNGENANKARKQDWLHNLWGPMPNENAKSLVQKVLQILRWLEERILLSVKLFWVQESVWPHRLPSYEATPTRNLTSSHQLHNVFWNTYLVYVTSLALN